MAAPPKVSAPKLAAPAVVTPKPAAPKVAGPAPPKIAGKRVKTVLVVDGDREHRARLVRLIREATETVPEAGSKEEPIAPAIHEADDGHAAWSLIEVTKPDLIVAEILIEGISGLQLARRIREHFKPPAHPPAVFFVTDMANEVDRYWALRNGAAAFVSKPFDEGFFRHRVKKILAADGAVPPASAWPEEGT